MSKASPFAFPVKTARTNGKQRNQLRQARREQQFDNHDRSYRAARRAAQEELLA